MISFEEMNAYVNGAQTDAGNVFIDANDLQEIIDRLQAAESRVTYLESAWQAEVIENKDRVIAKQEAENDRIKSKLDEMEKQEPVAEIAISLRTADLCAHLNGKGYKSLKSGDRLYAKPIPAQQLEEIPLSSHDSDCAVHNLPAYPNGPCNCSLSAQDSVEQIRERRMSQHSVHERDVQIRQQSLHRFNSANYTIEPAKRRLSDIKLEGHALRDDL